MYMGEHTNVTEKLHDIQKQGRTKGSLLDHIAIPVTAFFVATDLMTVHLYTESLFDERPEMAMLVAASIALLLDACPMLAGILWAGRMSLHSWWRVCFSLRSGRAGKSPFQYCPDNGILLPKGAERK